MSLPARLVIVLVVLALCALWAGSASATTTRFASPGGTTPASACTAVASPCSLPVALASAQAGDVLSLDAGSYDVQAITLPQLPLRWVATNRATRPVLTSAGLAATVFLTGSESGSSFEGLEIDNTSTSGPALATNADVDATVRSTVLKGSHCVVQPDGDQVAGELTIEDSMLSGPVGRTCATLGPATILRRSVVSLTAGIATQTPPAAVVTEGVVEDTRISGGLQLVGAAAVARRVIASGSTAIFGQGLIVDSVARADGNLGAAVAVDTPHGGTLRVINVTAVAAAAPAFEARAVVAPAGTMANFNFLVVSDSIARGAPTDLRATTSPLVCGLGMACEFGVIRIDRSNFVSRQPAAGGPGDSITVGPGNQSGDPLFTDPGAGDFHLRAGSPAIDAGDDPQGRALPTDADGAPRLQGLAIDLGAFEFSPPSAGSTDAGGSPPPGTGSPPTDPPPTDTNAPRLGRLHLSRARFRATAGTALTTTTSETGQLRIAVQRGLPGRRAHGRCVSTKRSGARCTRWVASGPAVSRAVKPGVVRVTFGGRTGTRRLVAGHYRFVVTAIDITGNRSAPRTISFTILPANR